MRMLLELLYHPQEWWC